MSHLMCVHIIFSWVWVGEWPPFGEELLTRMAICSLCILTICNFSYFPFWFWVLDLGSDFFGIGFSQCLNVASHGRQTEIYSNSLKVRLHLIKHPGFIFLSSLAQNLRNRVCVEYSQVN